ncbi:ABC transporter ATP-binding protein [Saccharibacillus sp. CPCC 101409]|uniref:ABC transporter ATP-binding protein n=1 Tax=Saccharibacillus sp. CPCC 101409 TaxID=3058041 RepID=UPI00267243C4|nr:ABC transporter ATP-binding protein [Saccharibacillus sp. CPCC 101409]MDO3413311.1 ABC transporter ATP-binding protein [Saccharibacillus sp. CPCC 101409]
MLSLNRVTKQYGSFTALEQIDLEFSRGVYALLAPNGAGKTTLIKMLSTLIFPTKGEILWNGDDIIGLDAAYRDMIGYLPQDFGYYRNHTPREFLRYMAAVKCLKRDRGARRADELIDLVGLSDVRNKKMRKFSGGMIQRVGIAQAMLNDPQILILDEPTAGLDPKERVRFRNLISSLSKDRIVILSTHIVSDIETIASSVILLKDRRLLTQDSPAAICGTLDGNVYETDDIEAIKAPHLVLTERQENGRTVTRFASERDCASAARVVNPNLEDVFLYVYRDEER